MEEPSKLMNRNFLLLWQGQSVSQIGNQIAIVVMLLWVKQATDSATLVGLIAMTSTLPVVLLGPIGGTFADRYSRRHIIIYSDAISGIIILSLAGLIILNPNGINLILLWLFTVSSLIAIVGSFFRPAITAAIPDLVPKNQIARANSLNEASVQIATLIGYSLGGILFQTLGIAVVFLFNGLTYIFSAISESFIIIPQKLSPKTSWKQALLSFRLDTIAGFKYVWHNAGMRTLFLTAASLNVFAVPIFVLLPFYVEDFLDVSATWYGFLMAGFGVGSLIGYLLVSLTSLSGRRRSTAMVFLVFGNSIARIALGIVQSPLVAFALMFSMGMAIAVITVLAVSILQLATCKNMRGRVFGLLGTLSNALTPLAMGFSGLIADWSGQNISLIYIICGSLSFLVAISLLINQELHSFLAYKE